MRIGVLALQGDFAKHGETLSALGHKVLPIKKPAHLAGIDLLVLPGGESTSMLKLISPELFATLQTTISGGLPVFATCAGLILLANEVSNPKQRSLALLDVGVERNSYGSQVESQIVNEFSWTAAGSALLQDKQLEHSNLKEIVLIRAPKITRVGEKVSTLLECTTAAGQTNSILVKSDNIIAATFHPEICNTEISNQPFFAYQLLLSLY